MPKNITVLHSALACALLTLEDQPIELPEVPEGWAARAQKALDSYDNDAIIFCAREILSAHSQYRADFDIKGWLFDLRNVTPRKPKQETAQLNH